MAPWTGLTDMAKQPEPPAPIRWQIFKIASKSVWLGSGEAPDEAAAIVKAAEEFKVDVAVCTRGGDDTAKRRNHPHRAAPPLAAPRRTASREGPRPQEFRGGTASPHPVSRTAHILIAPR